MESNFLMFSQRLTQQLQFLIEIDKLKEILRQSLLTQSQRRENSAEHCWHLAMMAMILSEYANESIDLMRVIKMALIHDIVEIDAGDTYIYDDNYDETVKAAQEQKAALRIFGLLPPDQAIELQALWEEFESRQTPSARFAAALDRLMPLLHNYHTQGISWQKHGVTRKQVETCNYPRITDGAKTLAEFAQTLVEDAVKKGYLSDFPANRLSEP
jgi:putative hydrolase of HD superfamily